MPLPTRSAPPRTPERGIDGMPPRKLQHTKEECKSAQGENCGCVQCSEKCCIKLRWERVNLNLKRARKEKRIVAMRINRLKRYGLDIFDEVDHELASIAEDAANDNPTNIWEIDSNASQAGCSDQEDISEKDAAHLGGEKYTCGDCENVYSLGAQCPCGY